MDVSFSDGTEIQAKAIPLAGDPTAIDHDWSAQGDFSYDGFVTVKDKQKAILKVGEVARVKSNGDIDYDDLVFRDIEWIKGPSAQILVVDAIAGDNVVFSNGDVCLNPPVNAFKFRNSVRAVKTVLSVTNGVVKLSDGTAFGERQQTYSVLNDRMQDDDEHARSDRVAK